MLHLRRCQIDQLKVILFVMLVSLSIWTLTSAFSLHLPHRSRLSKRCQLD